MLIDDDNAFSLGRILRREDTADVVVVTDECVRGKKRRGEKNDAETSERDSFEHVQTAHRIRRPGITRAVSFSAPQHQRGEERRRQNFGREDQQRRPITLPEASGKAPPR